MAEPVSFMCPIGFQHNTCGYCKSSPKRTSVNYYATSPRAVHPIHYQFLVDRGWRRSGTTFYKPDVRHACCPHYSVRIDAQQYRPSKSQRQIVNRWNKYILGIEYQHQIARLCPRTRGAKRVEKNTFDLRQAIHAAEDVNLKRPLDTKTAKHVEPAHSLEITLEPDTFTEEKYALFKHYQIEVHKESTEKNSRQSFKNFLCTGMSQLTFDADVTPRPIGSFHQLYRIDGRLAAIAVLDLMPYSVSSVYFIYHTDFSDQALGRVSAMLELSMALEKGYGYYYMGYYIQSCPKMRYKRDFKPTYVLDPITYAWDLMDEEMLKGMSSRHHYIASEERRKELRVSDQSDLSESDDELDSLHSDNPSLFTINMPGVAPLEEVLQTFPLAETLCSFDTKTYKKLGELAPEYEWDEESMLNPHSLQGTVAEFVACIGTDLARSIAIQMR